MKLEISKLKSQKELMKKNSEGEQHIVYGYLRAKDSGTGKAGSPYYIGIGNSHTRAFERHARGGKTRRFHDVPVPKDEALVRQFGVFPTRAAAAKREQELIARYGRKGIDEKGVLLNRTLGGEGTTGRKATAAQRARITRANKESLSVRTQSRAESITVNNANLYGIDVDRYTALSQKEKTAMRNFVNTNPGLSGNDWLAFRQSGVKPSPSNTIYGRVAKGGVQSEKRKAQMAKAQLERAAEKYGISLAFWEKLTMAERKRIRRGYARGIRGAALLEGLL
jgi:hypothetical protein